MSQTTYLTTPIYYANAFPHIGTAYTTIAADVLRRFYLQEKQEVFLLTGTDEHGLKIQKKAEELGKKPQELVDEVSQEFKNLWRELEIDYTHFIRTTDKAHKTVVTKVLAALYKKGAIYKGEYQGLYCVGCEQFKSPSDLVEGKCPDHNIKPELVKEESYLLKMTEKQEELIKKIESDQLKISPIKYKKEILSFLKNQTLEDISISRPQVSWGIPLPFDKTHTTYVWLDAFLSYLTGFGWQGPQDKESGKKISSNFFHLIGKDILRVHATIWPIMLMHLDLELPREIFVHGHILSAGKKMSKSLGNVISLREILDEIGVEATRYLLLSAGTFGEDVDVTHQRIKEKYNADLANGLGNLTSRIIKLSSGLNLDNWKQLLNYDKKRYEKALENLQFQKALAEIWKIIEESNTYIEKTKPWELAKKDEEEFKQVMAKLENNLTLISNLLRPFMPQTSLSIQKSLKVKKTDVLFPRVS